MVDLRPLLLGIGHVGSGLESGIRLEFGSVLGGLAAVAVAPVGLESEVAVGSQPEFAQDEVESAAVVAVAEEGSIPVLETGAAFAAAALESPVDPEPMLTAVVVHQTQKRRSSVAGPVNGQDAGNT
jgi:hypothetical protein